MTAVDTAPARQPVPIEVAIALFGDVEGIVDEVVPPWEGNPRQVGRVNEHRANMTEYLTRCALTMPVDDAAAKIGVCQRTIFRLRRLLRDAGYALPPMIPRDQKDGRFL